MIQRAVDSVFLGGVSVLFDVAVLILRRVRRPVAVTLPTDVLRTQNQY
jgi:hypothetical protein